MPFCLSFALHNPPVPHFDMIDPRPRSRQSSLLANVTAAVRPMDSSESLNSNPKAGERRRAYSDPNGHLSVVRRASIGRLRKTNSTPMGCDLAVVHEDSAIAKERTHQENRQEPTKVAEAPDEAKAIKRERRRTMRPGTPDALTLFNSLSAHPLTESSQRSEPSIRAPSDSSAVQEPESSQQKPTNSLGIAVVEVAGDCKVPQLPPLKVSSRISWSHPALTLVIPESTSSTPEVQLPLQLNPDTEPEGDNERPNSRPSSKRVTFSEIADEIITPRKQGATDRPISLRRQSSWSSVFLISTPTAPPAKAPKDQPAGKPILKRTSSCQSIVEEEKDTEEEAHVSAMMEKNLKRLSRSKSSRKSNTGTSKPSVTVVQLPHSLYSRTIADGRRAPLPPVIHNPSPPSSSSSTRSFGSSSSTYSVPEKEELFSPVSESELPQISRAAARRGPPRSGALRTPSASPPMRSPERFQREGEWLRRGSVHGLHRGAPPVPPLPKSLGAMRA